MYIRIHKHVDIGTSTFLSYSLSHFKIFTGHPWDRIVAMGQGVSQNQLSGVVHRGNPGDL